MIQNHVAHGLAGEFVGELAKFMLGDQHRLQRRRLINATVRTTDEGRIKGYYIHQRTEAPSLAKQLPRDAQLRQAQLRINEQLTRVIARLAMNIDHPREIRRSGIIEPILVTEPSP